MRKIAFGLLACLALVGCESEQEQRARIAPQLPPGCEIRSLGSYGGVGNVILVTCTNRRVNTMNYRTGGKVTYQYAVVAVEELE